MQKVMDKIDGSEEEMNDEQKELLAGVKPNFSEEQMKQLENICIKGCELFKCDYAGLDVAWNEKPMSPMRETVMYDVSRSTGAKMLRLAGGPHGGWCAGAPESTICVPDGQHLVVEANKRDHRLEFVVTAMRGREQWVGHSDMTWWRLS